jgi:hypothetical protein
MWCVSSSPVWMSGLHHRFGVGSPFWSSPVLLALVIRFRIVLVEANGCPLVGLWCGDVFTASRVAVLSRDGGCHTLISSIYCSAHIVLPSRAPGGVDGSRAQKAGTPIETAEAHFTFCLSRLDGNEILVHTGNAVPCRLSPHTSNGCMRSHYFRQCPEWTLLPHHTGWPESFSNLIASIPDHGPDFRPPGRSIRPVLPSSLSWMFSVALFRLLALFQMTLSPSITAPWDFCSFLMSVIGGNTVVSPFSSLWILTTNKKL